MNAMAHGAALLFTFAMLMVTAYFFAGFGAPAGAQA
jgi:hypothetical protein